MTLSRKEPVELSLEIKNLGEEPASATIAVYTTHRLALDTGGLKNNQEVKIDQLRPNGKKNWFFRLYPKVTTEIGENPVEVKILEHHAGDFSLVKRKYTLNLTLLARK